MGRGGATTRGGGRGYDASRITGMVRPGMRQLPPIREQARALEIGPLNQRILDRQQQTLESNRGRVERTNEQVWNRFEERALAPAQPNNPGDGIRSLAACTSVEATTRQWEDLQRFRLTADLDTDPLTRRFACARIHLLLARNDWMFSRIAAVLDACTDQTPREVEVPDLSFVPLASAAERAARRRQVITPLPQSDDVVAGIVSVPLSMRALGSTNGGQYVTSGRTTLTPQQAHEFQVARNHRVFGLEPIANGVLLFRPQIRRVLEHLNRNPAPPPQERF